MCSGIMDLDFLASPKCNCLLLNCTFSTNKINTDRYVTFSNNYNNCNKAYLFLLPHLMIFIDRQTKIDRLLKTHD